MYFINFEREKSKVMCMRIPYRPSFTLTFIYINIIPIYNWEIMFCVMYQKCIFVYFQWLWAVNTLNLNEITRSFGHKMQFSSPPVIILLFDILLCLLWEKAKSLFTQSFYRIFFPCFQHLYTEPCSTIYTENLYVFHTHCGHFFTISP